MKWWLTLSVASVLSAGTVAAGLAFERRPDVRNRRYFPDMARSFASDGQEPNAFLPHGQTAQAPVSGTIPRGYEPLASDPSVHGYVLAGHELVSPFGPAHPADMLRARTVFETYCMVCHGPNAEGDGPATRHGFPHPPSLLFGKALNMKDGHIFHIVTNGFRHMPSYASQIEPEDRWLAIAYVRELQTRAP